MTSGDLDFNVPVAGPKEVSSLSSTFNGMLSGAPPQSRSRGSTPALRTFGSRGASGLRHRSRDPQPAELHQPLNRLFEGTNMLQSPNTNAPSTLIS
ncbi:MAG: hypothetical protein IPG76_24810 [Acidobacteria bacterium]|nr:hypothetical protein [Acidobacteriota bacterium]